MNITELQSKVMLSSLTISTWVARRYDGKVTEEVEKSHSARGIGRFNKRLLPEHAPSYAEVLSIGSRIRSHYYGRTLKYDQLGVRLLPTMVYMELADRLRAMKDEFDLAVSVFLTNYLDLKEQARAEMHTLYNEADYPSLAELKGKFGVKLSVLPFPDASQFGVDLPTDVLTTLRTEVDAHAMASIQTANKDLVGRLYEAVSTMASRLYASGNVRLDVANHVRELCDLLPKLNFSDDPKLAHILSEAKRHLAAHNGAELKESSVLRSQVASKATEIEGLMAAFMGGAPAVPLTDQVTAPPATAVSFLAAA
ncbi:MULTISPECIES: hypothetical protein [Burkholderia cepacia complex]|uniref:DUF3150 domain-containing protein n=3 Tax=Burkholderia cepacia complex TaxID=87882 RepID=A0A0H3KQS9_BURM1|nr:MULTISPECIES: hypothetical protein [Burkholderia cepacia complex]ABX19274.1 conserved hypothetical protein [Burkholderia multivorans ATCC 17616]AIO71941.1 hypothetical protein DM80_5824 [Burkholderia multivorans]AOK69207.1 hypothetical protein WM33_26445 [Burkholderia multivorans]AYY99179.1 hypothetical protein EGY19_17035 [Burkholderia multivorans]KVV34465.1 hypothetical protein WK80_03165 [Burkholderia multivorans]